jgi:hypothetical protein
VDGAPERVRLIVRDGTGRETDSFAMQRSDDPIWTGDIPIEDVSDAGSTYTVAAYYPDGRASSRSAQIVALDRVLKSAPDIAPGRARTILEAPIGNGAGQLGRLGGDEGATQLPPSFAIDEPRGRILVLDAAKERLAVFEDGRIASALNVGSTTASDVVTDSEGSAFVLDQAKDKLIELTGRDRRSWSSVGTRHHGRGARIEHNEATATTYVRDASQGRLLPLVRRGDVVDRKDRASRARDGVPTSRGDLAVEADRQHVTYGNIGDRSVGYRVDFSDEVLDAGETVVDGKGTIWSLVGVYRSDAGRAATMLVSVDPHTGKSHMTEVATSVPGDVTRRLAPADEGAVVLEVTGDSLLLNRYDDLAEGSQE